MGTDEMIWVNVPKTSTAAKPIVAYTSEQAALDAYRVADGYHSPEVAKLYRPDLRPIYGGPTLLEALWGEMDRLMEALMTGQAADGDRFRAEELAWVLAIVSNPYDPSVDRIRAETLERWKAQQAFEVAQEAALNPEDEGPMEPGGMMGDGIK